VREWQRGLSTETLREFTGLFRQQQRGYAFGRFSLPNEADVAAALAENRVVWARHGATLAAAALFRRLKRGSQRADFTGRSFAIGAGAAYVSHFAWVRDAEAARVLARLRLAPEVWIEAFEEDAQTVKLLERHGFAWATTRVLASSDVRGIYHRGDGIVPPPLPPEEMATLAVLRHDFIDAEERAALLAEVERGAAWTQHYSTYNRRKSWTAFSLAGYKPGDPTFVIKPNEMSKVWRAENATLLSAEAVPTVLAGRFPRTMAVVARLPGAKERVRLMRLAPNGELSRHADITDRDAGVADGKIARLHLPLRTTPLVRFSAWSARGAHLEASFPARCVFYLDQRKPHAVVNASPQCDRVHLVVDCIASKELRQWISASL